MYIAAAYYLWWVPVALASIMLAGFSITASSAYAFAGLVIVPLGGICAVTGIVLVLVELNRSKKHAEKVRKKLYHQGITVIALLLLNFPIAAVFIWTAASLDMQPAKTRSLSPDRNWIAESYNLTEGQKPLHGNGVRLRPYWSLIRKKASVQVFAGHCSKDPRLSWIDKKELLIECYRPKQVAIKKMQSGDIIIRYR